MMHKYIPQDRKFRVDRRDLAVLRFERGSETMKGGWGVQLVDFAADLVGDKLALEICHGVPVSNSSPKTG